TAAIVPYVNEVIPYEDSAKAQSLAYTMTSIGSVLASLIGGFLYDRTTVTNTLWISFGICFVAAVIAFLGVEKDQP
ncbi:MAG: MFS transporter, partial [Oscillospiraceae bacterium]|nr:MFS transporter [Oscillospiraceae bacterium]